METVSQPLVVDPKLPQHCGMEIMNGDVILGDRVTKLVRRAPAGTTLDTGTSHPDREGLNVVIPATALRHRGAPELSPPDNEGVLQKPTLLEVLDERCGGLVNMTGDGVDCALDVAVMVPSAVVELDKANAAFGKTSSNEAVGGE